MRVVDHLPATKDTADTNYCRHHGPRRPRPRAARSAADDNLIKGAAGAAVQNFNLMYGFPETTALL